MTIDEMIAVLEAAKAGKQIEYRSRVSGQWLEHNEPSWDFDRVDYRVKREPREWWASVYPEDLHGNYCGQIYSERRPAEADGRTRTLVKVREVL